MRLLENTEIHFISGGATYDEIFDAGIVYGGAIGVVGGALIGCATPMGILGIIPV